MDASLSWLCHTSLFSANVAMGKLTCLLLVALLGGCGNKGPLYLAQETTLTPWRDRGGAVLPLSPLLGAPGDG